MQAQVPDSRGKGRAALKFLSGGIVVKVESPIVGIGSRLVGLGAAGEATVLLLDLLDDENIMFEGFLVE